MAPQTPRVIIGLSREVERVLRAFYIAQMTQLAPFMRCRGGDALDVGSCAVGARVQVCRAVQHLRALYGRPVALNAPSGRVSYNCICSSRCRTPFPVLWGHVVETSYRLLAVHHICGYAQSKMWRKNAQLFLQNSYSGASRVYASYDLLQLQV